MSIIENAAIDVTIEARRALSELHSDYIRRMGNLGYRRIVVGGEYIWKRDEEQLGRCETILCPFQ